MKVNKKIIQILQLLSHNSKLTSKEIAKKIKTTQQNASYLLNKLNDEKYIHSYKVLIDSSKFGENTFYVLLRLKEYSKEDLDLFINELKKTNEICGIDILFGNFDIILKFIATSPAHFNKVLNKILLSNQQRIFDYKILTQIVLYKFSLNFLERNRISKKVIISGNKEYISTNETEKKILNLITQNEKINYTQIAQKLNTTAKTISLKIKNLEKKKIIHGYSININHNKSNLKKFYLFLKLDIKELEENKEFEKCIQNSPFIVEYLKVFGDWDKILIIETKTSQEFKELLFTLKEKFSGSLIDYNFLESEEIKLWKYLPKLKI